MDLTNRGVLAEQQAVTLAKLGHVANQQQTAGDLGARLRRCDHRDAATQQRDVRALLELLDDRFTSLERLADRTVVESEFGQAHPDRVRLDADAVQRRVRIG